MFNMDTFLPVLAKALQGWMGVFVVTLILIALVYLFNQLFSNDSKKQRILHCRRPDSRLGGVSVSMGEADTPLF